MSWRSINLIGNIIMVTRRVCYRRCSVERARHGRDPARERGRGRDAAAQVPPPLYDVRLVAGLQRLGESGARGCRRSGQRARDGTAQHGTNQVVISHVAYKDTNWLTSYYYIIHKHRNSVWCNKMVLRTGFELDV